MTYSHTSKHKASVAMKVAAVCFCAYFFTIPQTAAQDYNPRLERIENEIETLSRAVFRGETPPPSMGASDNASAARQANVELRLNSIEEELRNLTGQIEELSFENTRLQNRLNAMSDMLDSMMAAKQEDQAANGSNFGESAPLVADGLGVASNDISRPTGDVAADQTQGTLGTLPIQNMNEPDNSVMPDLANDPVALYDQSFGLLKESKYDQAEQGFAKFLSEYPQHNLAENARYWLGESFYVRGQYEKAAREFANGYQAFPEGSKAPDSLLKLAMSLAGMNETGDACVAFSQLLKQFPSAPSSILSRAEKEREKLSCKN